MRFKVMTSEWVALALMSAFFVGVAVPAEAMKVKAQASYHAAQQSGKQVGQKVAQQADHKKMEAKHFVPVSSSTGLLGELQSFEILDIDGHDFSSSRQNVPAEVLEYARTAILNDERLRYRSPAQGLLRFSCANAACSKIRAEVTQGFNGPVVWQTEQTYEPSFWVNFSFMPDSKKFARQVVDKLAADYQKALKPVPVKINIQED